ncbi:MAG: hypothetical protein ACE5IL_08460 [Myxococcota bacterium]
MRLWIAIAVLPLSALCLTGCSLWPHSAGALASGQTLERVRDTDVLALVSRMESFYGALEGRSLDSVDTFEDPRLRSFFESNAAFADYLAALASEVRKANFRHANALRVRVRSFRFPDSSTASVQVELQGRHQRGLRFWTLALEREDTWKLVEGSWWISPDKL